MTGGLMALILASVGLSAVAQMLLKIGVGQIADRGAGVVSVMTSYLLNPYVFGGLALYGLGAMLWLFVLARLPLTAAYPFVGLGFIMTMALGWGLLGESVSLTRIAGTVLIAMGCVLVARSVG